MMEARHFPVFETRPSDDFIERWREHIKETGHPETFENVSTVPPADMSNVVVLSGELKVPIMRREDQALVPCPLCCPNSPKFGTGRLLYFPMEKIVAAVGRTCAKRHLGEDYERAVEQYGRETEGRNILHVWADLQRKAPALREMAAQLLPVAEALQQARRDFGREAEAFLHDYRVNRPMDLAGNANYSIHAVVTTRDTGLKDRKGKKVYETVQLGTIVGYEFCAKYKPATKLRAVVKDLEDLDSPLPDWRPGAEDGGERLDELLRRGRAAVSAVKSMKKIRDYVSDARGFLHVNNLRMFETWGALPESPFTRLSFRRTGSWIFLDAESYDGQYRASIKVSDDLFAAVPDVNPSLFRIRGFSRRSKNGTPSRTLSGTESKYGRSANTMTSNC